MLAYFLFLIQLNIAWAAAPSHQPFTALLQKYVVLEGKNSNVRYVDLWRKDLASLDKYLDSLEAISRDDFDKWSTPDRLAFLINCYNGFAVKLIVDSIPDGTPPVSIEVLGSILTSPFKKKFFSLFSHRAHLEGLRSEIEALDDPRALFALACTGKACPALRAEAYDATKLNEQLEQAAKNFMNDANKNRFNAAKNVFELSILIEKNHRIFESSKKIPGGLQTFLLSRMENLPENAKAQLKANQAKFRFLDFDWNLNVAPSLELPKPAPSATAGKETSPIPTASSGPEKK